MKSTLRIPNLPRLLLAIPILLVVAILIGGYWFYQFQEEQTRKSLEADLSTIAQLKIVQIDSWRDERVSDASIISGDKLLTQQISNWQTTRTSIEEKTILNELQNFKNTYHYSDVLLLDTGGNVLLSLSGATDTLSPVVQQQIQTALQGHISLLSSLYLEPSKNNPRMDGIAPLFLNQGGTDILIGAVLLRIDPNEFLYPFIQTWPSNSRTGETLLVVRDGNDVLYLNELRHRSNTALTLRIPLNQTELPAVKAVLGTQGIVQGQDYRGVEVVAATGAIPKSNWFLVAKIDSDEAFADMNFRSVLILALVLGTVISVLAVVLVIIIQFRRKQSQVNYLARIAQLQLEQDLVFNRLLMGRSSDALFVIDPETARVLDANETACERLGYTREELVELIVSDFGLPYTLEQWAVMVQTVKTEGSKVIETTHRRKGGSAFPVEVSKTYVEANGKGYLIESVRDITERKQAEQALNLAHKRTSDILESINDAFYALDSEERFTFINNKTEELWKIPREELLGKKIWDVFPQMVGTPQYNKLHQALTEQSQVEFEVYSAVVNEWVAVKVYPAGGGISVYFHDITERKNMEEALRRSETLYRMLARNLPDSAVIVFDRDMRYLVAEGGALARNGYSPEMLEGKTLQEVNQPEEVNKLLPYFQAALAGLENTFEEYRGDMVFLVKAVPIKDQRGKIIGGMLFSQDITSLKQAEQFLSNEKERLSVTLRSIGDGVITTNLDGHVTLLNRVAENLTGWNQSEAVGRPLDEIFQLLYEDSLKPQKSPLAETLKTGEVQTLRNHTLLVAQDGTRYSIADSCAPIRNRDSSIIGAVLVFRDVTAELKLKEELQKTDKLESLGIFAGGLAHDFNNLLSGIIGYLDLTKLSINDPQLTDITEMAEYINQAMAAATRAKDLTVQLLTFSKGGAPVKKIVDLSSSIEESARFMLHGTNIEPVFKLSERLAPVEVDPGQLGQVIQNLVLNAIQAMPEGGTLTITAQNIELKDDISLPLAEGSYVLISVIDQGKGIIPENLSRIFDPFFTTKPKGSGLGLAVCYSIIQQHNGYIRVESQMGQGTCFYIYLPTSNQRLITKHHTDTLSPDIFVTNTRPMKILVMDDESFLRNMLKKLLLKLGHMVDVAAEGEQAYQLYKDAMGTGQQFDIVLLDLTVPGGLGGQQTFAKLLELDPKVTAVVCSGYSSDPIMSNFHEFGYKAVLPKPYQINDLKKVLARLAEESKDKDVTTP